MEKCQNEIKPGQSTKNNSQTVDAEAAVDDYDGGPISLDNIDSKLYLGNVSAAVDVETLNKYNITHILTLDICPLPRRITELPHLHCKFIHISDQSKEDLLSILEDTNKFIDDALENGTILVHCYFGMSRSAAIVIGHVMKKYSLSYEEAFEKVKQKRKIVFPNEGFVYQLKLYGEMGYKIDKNNYKYKLFRLTLAADYVKKSKILPRCYMDLIKPDPGLTTVMPEPTVYRCKKCRRIVACESNIIVHAEKNKLIWNSSKPFIDDTTTDNSDREICMKTYFIEPLAWMKNVAQSQQGKLNCPKCDTKLGSYSWIMGCQCPCGTKVSPAFYLVPSKVEWSNAVKNIQMTL